MLCFRCGHGIPMGALACPSCGQTIAAARKAPPSTPVARPVPNDPLPVVTEQLNLSDLEPLAADTDPRGTVPDMFERGHTRRDLVPPPPEPWPQPAAPDRRQASRTPAGSSQSVLVPLVASRSRGMTSPGHAATDDVLFDDAEDKELRPRDPTIHFDRKIVRRRTGPFGKLARTLGDDLVPFLIGVGLFVLGVVGILVALVRRGWL